MSRWERPAGPNDQVMSPTGDMAFVGMDAKTRDPAQMLTGWYQEGYNVRLENGGMATRNGCVCPANFNYVQFGQIYGVGVYSDPNGQEWLALAVSNGVWFCGDGVSAQFLPMDTIINYTVEFSQAFQNFYMWRGPKMAPLMWKGDWAVYWQSLPDPSQGSPPDTTRKPMPNAVTAECFSNRMLVPHDRDGVAISDIGESYYQWAVNDFRVNFGEADTLVRVFPWVQATVICFKQHSIYQLGNVTGDLSSIILQKLPGTLGLVALKAVTAVAGDIYFLDWGGVYTINQVFESSPQAAALPISDSIKPVIDAINWNAAAGIRAENRRERVYFAVPLKNATRNNALLVYNMMSTSWEGIDTFGDPDYRIDDLVKTNYIGARRIFAVDRQKGLVVVLEQGRTDLLGNDIEHEHQIQFGLLTRGYAGVGARNTFPRVGITISTWNPNFSVQAYVDGSNAKDLVANRTKSNTKYETFGMPAWNPTNLKDDHATARRKDYSVGFQTGYPPGNPPEKQGFKLGENGIQVEREQEATERFQVDMSGRYCQFKIENTSGSIGVRSVVLEDYEDDREPRHHT